MALVEAYMNTMLPPDLPEWDEAVCEAYQLKKVIIESGQTSIKLFTAGRFPRYFATAPYFYDGGVQTDAGKICKEVSDKLYFLMREFQSRYLLLKTRYEIKLDIKNPVKTDSDYYTFLLDLTAGADKVWNRSLKAKTRNQVRKAEKYNFDIQTGRTSLLQDFYSVISEGWRDLGTPTHSLEFYRFIIEKLKNHSRLMVIYHQGEPVSCALLLILNNVIYHPYSCTLKRYKSSCVNNLLYWEIIKFACDNNYNSFDMGRSRIGQGTFKYKKSWGAEPMQLYYTYILKDESDMPSYDNIFYKLATNAWSHLPVVLANKIGPSLIKNVL
jgi:FemAB-related protein (PEP-CTERM system-associated)